MHGCLNKSAPPSVSGIRARTRVMTEQDEYLTEQFRILSKRVTRSGRLSVALGLLAFAFAIWAFWISSGADDRIESATSEIRDTTSEIKDDAEIIRATAIAAERSTTALVSNVDEVSDKATATIGALRRVDSKADETIHALVEIGQDIDATSDYILALGQITQTLADATKTIRGATQQIQRSVDEYHIELMGAIRDVGQSLEGSAELDEQPQSPEGGNGSQPDPSVEVIGGRRGPTDVDKLPNGDIPCATTSINCRYLKVTMVDFNPGQYQVTCEHDGWSRFSGGAWGRYVQIIGEDGDSVHSAPCFINFDRLVGQGVRVSVTLLDENGAPVAGATVLSAWTRDTAEL